MLSRPLAPAARNPMRCQPTAPQSACSGPAGVLAVDGLQQPPEDRRGGPRGTKGVSGYPRESPAVVPSSPCFGSPAVLQAVPILPSSSLHSPAEPALCDCFICSPLHNQPPYVTLGLVATSILILIVARFSS